MRGRDPHARRCCNAAGSARDIGSGLKLHPTVKIAARFPHPIDHGDVPMHRVTEFAPEPHHRWFGQPARHVALALADSSADYADALANWEHVAVYYAAIRSEGSGRVHRAARVCARRSSCTT